MHKKKRSLTEAIVHGQAESRFDGIVILDPKDFSADKGMMKFLELGKDWTKCGICINAFVL